MMKMAQVGVRTRARALALAATTAAAAATAGTARKRKVSNQELVVSTSYIELRSSTRRRMVITPENSVSVSPEMNSGHRSVIQNKYSSPSSDHTSTSCCSSNDGSSGQRIKNKFSDLEVESVEVETSVYYSCRERRETTPSSQLRPESSEELESTARPSPEASIRRRSTAEKMPTESELEEFFTQAEKNIQKQFTDKYNYDFVKDEPLKGRYEWVRLKP